MTGGLIYQAINCLEILQSFAEEASPNFQCSMYLLAIFYVCILISWTLFCLVLSSICCIGLWLPLAILRPRWFLSAREELFEDEDWLGESTRARGRRLGLRGLRKLPFSRAVLGFRDGFECVVCLVSFQEDEVICQLECSRLHMFHKSCLRKWIRAGKDSCPICRQEIQRVHPNN